MRSHRQLPRAGCRRSPRPVPLHCPVTALVPRTSGPVVGWEERWPGRSHLTSVEPFLRKMSGSMSRHGSSDEIMRSTEPESGAFPRIFGVREAIFPGPLRGHLRAAIEKRDPTPASVPGRITYDNVVGHIPIKVNEGGDHVLMGQALRALRQWTIHRQDLRSCLLSGCPISQRASL